jgi:hypothetical protein
MDKKSTKPKKSKPLLGLNTDQLANLSVEDILNNKVAIQMVLHYYRQLTDENQALKNEVNTLETYQAAYERKSSDTMSGSILLLLSNLLVGFGVNLLTAGAEGNSGGITLAIGLILAAAGFYFNFFKDMD